MPPDCLVKPMKPWLDEFLEMQNDDLRRGVMTGMVQALFLNASSEVHSRDFAAYISNQFLP